MHWFLDKLNLYTERQAIICDDIIYTFKDLLCNIEKCKDYLFDNNIKQFEVTAIVSDYNFDAISMFFALAENKNTVVPITTTNNEEVKIRLQEGYVDNVIYMNNGIFSCVKVYSSQEKHPLFSKLKETNSAGLILFSSGTTGKPKAMVENLDLILTKFKKDRKVLRTLEFLLFDHIGGLDVFLNILSSGGCIIIPKSRLPEDVAESIDKYKAELLPTSPTFLNLLILSECYKKYDLSSLKLITYGSEPMPDVVLERLHQILPGVRLKQTYGLSELGVLSTKSKRSDSLYMKIGGENFEYKIIDNQLYVKSKIAMLGYLNAENPFTEDGWFPTGDLAEINDEGYIRILGRIKEFINVGGQKVLPAEVEGVIMHLDYIKDVMVRPEKSPIMGEIVVADVSLKYDIDRKQVKKEILNYCKSNLDEYKVPMRIKILDNIEFGERFKKIRNNTNN